MRATVLMDNTSSAPLFFEWGFCVHVEHEGSSYLLDSGSSGRYVHNAHLLGVDLSAVDYAVLSHAHYDHSGGYHEFFQENSKACLFISSACGEDCYGKVGPKRRYIGIPRGLLKEYHARISLSGDMTPLGRGAWIVSHQGKDLSPVGRRVHQYVLREGHLIPDDYAHEQSLVFETARGLVVMNSCSHGGIKTIFEDVLGCFPGAHIHAVIGGLHLSKARPETVLEVAQVIRNLEIDLVITGHCTGDDAFRILHRELGDKVRQTSVGLRIEVKENDERHEL